MARVELVCLDCGVISTPDFNHFKGKCLCCGSRKHRVDYCGDTYHSAARLKHHSLTEQSRAGIFFQEDAVQNI